MRDAGRDALNMEIRPEAPETPSSKAAGAIVLTAIRKRYGSVAALDGIDLSVRAGDIYGFLGRNGAGKSTTIKVLAGLVKPDQGTVNLLGAARPASDHGLRKRVGFLIETPSFLSHLNAVENLCCHWLLQGRGMSGGGNCGCSA